MQIAVTQENPLSLDEVIDHLQETKKALTEANKVARKLSKTKSELEAQVMERLDSGDDSDKYLAAISESKEPSVEDWDTTLAHVIQIKGWHLLQRRLSTPALREELQLNGDFPGVEMKPVRKLSVKAV
ncbi:hypothetical protein [Parendozoicomonas haliclonae]|uniref:Uncharacterized protein n=1 Tax=Parendozoicomonas haliclonae TaxID=1960125 RepID=A0A1X7AGR0_9GAMM|nr:hypothetical protein [Parendozoicomonas haliclonae]SMA33637.1 hypothetical protein EHSB41UT_00309 [Parendozoicomonas haliclonae]